MPHSEARAWWADVQDVRESIERRRAGLPDASAPLEAPVERRFARRAIESLPPLDDLEWTSGSPVHSGARLDRTGRAPRADSRGSAPRRAADRHRAGTAGSDFAVDADTRGAATVPPPAVSATGTAALVSPAARRTVQVTGRPVPAPTLPRLVEVERRRPARRPSDRVGPRPDRIAMWAVLLGFFLILVAATSSNAAVHQGHGADRAEGHGADRAAVALHAPAR